MKKIMIVDDDPSLATVLKTMLGADYEVAIFPNGAAALDGVGRIQPDLIATDVLMPEMTGYELLVNLKRPDSPYRNIPVLVMSSRESVRSIFDEKDMVCFLPKPFSVEEFLKKVSEIVGSV